MDDKQIETKELAETVIHIARVARVVRGGRRFRFRALVAVGNGHDRVGVGIAKGSDVQRAVTKAVETAKKQMITIPLTEETIPHESLAKVAGSKVLIMPAAPGTGVIAGGTVRSIIDLTGIHNVLSKTHGSTNKTNVAYATIEALKSLVPREDWLLTKVRAASRRATAVAKKPTVAKKKAPAKAKSGAQK